MNDAETTSDRASDVDAQWEAIADNFATLGRAVAGMRAMTARSDVTAGDRWSAVVEGFTAVEGTLLALNNGAVAAFRHLEAERVAHMEAIEKLIGGFSRLVDGHEQVFEIVNVVYRDVEDLQQDRSADGRADPDEAPPGGRLGGFWPSPN